MSIPTRYSACGTGAAYRALLKIASASPPRSYAFGRRVLPPRGTTYINATNATMTTAAIATMATVEAAITTFAVLSAARTPETYA